MNPYTRIYPAFKGAVNSKLTSAILKKDAPFKEDISDITSKKTLYPVIIDLTTSLLIPAVTG